MMVQGHTVESTSERIGAGLNRVGGRRSGRPPTLTPEQVEECRRMYAVPPSVRRVVHIMKVYQGTVKRAIELAADPSNREA